MIIILLIIVALATTSFVVLNQSKFGKKPSGKRLERIQQSPNYKDGQFQNLSPTPQFAEDASMFGVMLDFMFKKSPKNKPNEDIPSIKNNLHLIPIDSNILVWFGHSSYYIQLDGKRYLVDPVFSGNASPIPGSVKSFKGSNTYSVDDFPNIDVLLITHDHYDHLDYETILALKNKTSQVICGLGVGEHFEHWGYNVNIINEMDWYESVQIDGNNTVFVEPTRHFSGRSFARNNTLWVSFVLQSDSIRLFLGGDSGYDTHYADMGKKYGSFDLAIIENGQYNKNWPYIHHHPEQVLKAATDMNAKRILPVHSSKFALAKHPWDEPLSLLSQLNQSYNFPLVTPLIGEIVNLNDPNQLFTKWWEKIN